MELIDRVGSISPFRGSTSLMYQWSQSEGWFDQGTYQMANSIYLATAPINPWATSASTPFSWGVQYTNLGGTMAGFASADRSEHGAMALSLFAPIPKLNLMGFAPNTIKGAAAGINTSLVIATTRLPVSTSLNFGGRYLTSSGLTSLKSIPVLSLAEEATFTAGNYITVQSASDMVLWRAGTAGNQWGQFYTFDAPISVIKTSIDAAVLPVWPGGATSPLNTAFAIRFPAGTYMNIGPVAYQGGWYVGGTQQIFIKQPWNIQGTQLMKQVPLN